LNPDLEGAKHLGKRAGLALNSKLDSVEQAEGVIVEVAREVGFGEAEQRLISFALHE